LSRDLVRFDQQLADQVSQLPAFFSNAPVLVDFEMVDGGEGLDFSALVAAMRERRLVPVAARNLSPEMQPAAIRAGLGLLKGGVSPASRPPAQPASQASASPSGQAAPDTSAHATREPSAERLAPDRDQSVGGKLVTQPIRSGKIVYAQQQDLVMMAAVNAGGEVIADGNIHIYAPLRGRALAGAHGNEGARIFCSSLEAELVSIAGQYLSADELPADCRGKAVQIFLEGQQVIVQRL